MTDIALRVLLAAFSVYRIANMLTKEGGPFNIFGKFRGWLYTRYEVARMLETKLFWNLYETQKTWSTILDLFTCPYCIGVWLSFIFIAFVYYHNWFADLLLLGFGIAGMQALLQKVGDCLGRESTTN